jgi:hypothetical protein
VQGFENSPTGISKFLVLGGLYVPTDPATGQLWTRGLVHLKVHIKLYIMPAGRFILRGSWASAAGLWQFLHRNFEIFDFGGTLCTHYGTGRLAMDKGVPIC